MLISERNPDSVYLLPLITVLDENGEERRDVYSFNTVTKEVELLFFNEKGEVKVIKTPENPEGEPALQKVIKPNWKVVFKKNGKEVISFLDKSGKPKIIIP